MINSTLERNLDFPEHRKICRRPIQLMEFPWITPDHLIMLGRVNFTGCDAAAKRYETDGDFVIVPNHPGQWGLHFHLDGEFFPQLPNESGFRGFPGIQLASGKLPPAAQVPPLRTSARQKFSPRIFNNTANYFDHFAAN
jgi:hypothetical protein